MPFPWKKAKATCISQLVANLQQSPNRTKPLVVESGFPTSLIDPFVKNHDQLRESPKPKSCLLHEIQTQSSTPTGALSSSLSQLFLPPLFIQNLQLSPQIDPGKEVLIKRKRECKEGFAFHSTLFKIFIIMALAVNTKNLAIWIIMAVFLLVLIKFVGICFLGFLKPNSKMLFLGSGIQKCLLVLQRWDCELRRSSSFTVEEQEGTSRFLDSCRLIELEDNNCLIGEIQITEPKPECASLEMLMKVEDMLQKSSERFMIRNNELSQKARIKRTLVKKLVPKNLRLIKKQWKIKKKKDELEEELEEKKQGLDDDDDDYNDDPRQDESKQTKKESCKGDDKMVSSSTLVELLCVESKRGVTVIEKKKIGYPIVFMIVFPLTGLVVGKGFALLLTFLWCLIMRYIGRLRKC